jgi:phosphopantothenoylcysteine decarboxylase / phosphopantothenate---cysteine ligase
VVAPATADLIAKMAHGLAGRFSHHAVPGLHRPGAAGAGDERQHVAAPATQAKLETLRAAAIACRTRQRLPGLRHDRTGPHGGPRGDRRRHRTRGAARHDLEGETVLLTAGPTQEPLDPVRYISNRSSGKMGYALAEAAAARGARVVLISGPVHLARRAAWK